MQNTLKSILPAMTSLLIGMLVFILLSTVLSAVTFPPEAARYAYSILAILILYYLSKAFLHYENIPLSVVNLKPNQGTWVRLAVGLVIGASIAGLMLLALFTITTLSIERVDTHMLWSFLVATMVFIPLALMEELLFRGYPFFRLLQIIHVRWVILITAVLFALYHYDGSQSLFSLLLGPGIWGVTFGVAAYLSQSIALPLGIHISVNLLQAMFGLKTAYTPMWAVTEQTDALAMNMDPEVLGLSMQLLLLMVTVIVLEVLTRRMKGAQVD
jgi:membrane protease YdiL (CAAX protease family)